MPDLIPSAGLLLRKENPLRFLLVHASGPMGVGRPYGLPKGEPNKDEPIKDAACRETMEETGVKAPDVLQYLGFIDYVDGGGQITQSVCLLWPRSRGLPGNMCFMGS